jgi:hypothetical protein
MLKTLVFTVIVAAFGFANQPLPVAGCACPEVANVQKTWSSSGSLAYTWTGSGQATQYKLWYYHQETGQTSTPVYTTATSHTFSSLAAGHYTLYFVAICGSEPSGFIGIEDMVTI